MQLELFFKFNGNCHEAATFYAKVFKSEVKNLMTYGQAPPDPDFPLQESDKNKVMYADVQIGGVTVMFMDTSSDRPFVTGNNINPTISLNDKVEVERVFNELKEGG